MIEQDLLQTLILDQKYVVAEPSYVTVEEEDQMIREHGENLAQTYGLDNPIGLHLAIEDLKRDPSIASRIDDVLLAYSSMIAVNRIYPPKHFFTNQKLGSISNPMYQEAYFAALSIERTAVLAFTQDSLARIGSIVSSEALQNREYTHLKAKRTIGTEGNLQSQLKQLGQDMASKYGLDNVAGLMSDLPTSPNPLLNHQVVAEYSATLALERIPVPTNGTMDTIPGKVNWIKIATDEQNAIDVLTAGTLQRNENLINFVY